MFRKTFESIFTKSFTRPLAYIDSFTKRALTTATTESQPLSHPLYLDLLSDHGFKTVFANHDFLQDFLRAAFNDSTLRVTKLLTNSFSSNQHLKKSETDIKCEIETSSPKSMSKRCIVEMQRAMNTSILPRMIHYASRDYADQTGPLQRYEDAMPVRLLLIAEYPLPDLKAIGFDDVPLVPVELIARAKGRAEVLSDRLRWDIVNINQAPKLTEIIEGTNYSRFEQWLALLRDIGNLKFDIQSQLTDAVFHSVTEKVMWEKLSPQEQASELERRDSVKMLHAQVEYLKTVEEENKKLRELLARMQK